MLGCRCVEFDGVDDYLLLPPRDVLGVGFWIFLRSDQRRQTYFLLDGIYDTFVDVVGTQPTETWYPEVFFASV